MRYYLAASLMATLIVPAFCQSEVSRRNSDVGQLSAPAKVSFEESEAITLLQAAEGEAAGLVAEMRPWVYWQIGLGYQSTNRAKALDLFQRALTAARLAVKAHPGEKPKNDLLARASGHPSLPPGLQLESDIARSMVLLEPKRAAELVDQVDIEVRGVIWISALNSLEKEGRFEQAREMLNRISGQDEMPYDSAIRLMDEFKSEQSAELAQLFLAALASYHDHAPHPLFKDDFPVMLSRFWKRLPNQAVQQAIDEILQQAGKGADQGSYSVVSETASTTVSSLYQYRVLQIMPLLQEFDPPAARRYRQEYPALAAGNPSNATPAATNGGPSFHPSGSYYTVLASAREQAAAQRVAAKSDAGQVGEAMSEAGNVRDPGLRAQVYEYIARIASKKPDGSAAAALEGMLSAAENLPPGEGFRYYGSAAEIFRDIGRLDDARNTVARGLAVAEKLYQKDSDDADPNTAFKAFWPSTNAYCVMFRQAARVSPAWAASLLQAIKAPEIKVAAEIALAGGWLKTPIGPSTIMTIHKSGSSVFLGARQ